MIDPANKNLSVSRQCWILKINRSTFYYKKRPIKPIDLKLMRLIDQQYLKTPTWGSRSMRNHLRRLGAIKSTATCSAANGSNGPAGHQSQTQNQPSASGTQGVSLSSQEFEDKP